MNRCGVLLCHNIDKCDMFHHRCILFRVKIGICYISFILSFFKMQHYFLLHFKDTLIYIHNNGTRFQSHFYPVVYIHVYKPGMFAWGTCYHTRLLSYPHQHIQSAILDLTAVWCHHFQYASQNQSKRIETIRHVVSMLSSISPLCLYQTFWQSY